MEEMDRFPRVNLRATGTGVCVKVMKMNREAALAFSNQFRSARQGALADSEAYEPIIHVVERLGSLLDRRISSLGSYAQSIATLAARSPLSMEIPSKWPDFHAPFERTYRHFKDARNDALHQGAFARRLTEHAVQLSIVLEDALRRSMEDPTIGDFMVRNPICAAEWQPLSFVRQLMLANAFSFLPMRRGEKWYLISDVQVASYLGSEPADRKKRLAVTVDAAAPELQLYETSPIPLNTPLKDALSHFRSSSHPLLILATVDHMDLVGIVTAFDLL